MRKYTQRELKNLVAIGAAENITNYSFEQTKALLHSIDYEKIGYSTGVNGMNGGLLQDRQTGRLYAITARNSTLAQVF